MAETKSGKSKRQSQRLPTIPPLKGNTESQTRTLTSWWVSPEFHIGKSKCIIIFKPGFVTDGASIPHWLWGICGYPFSFPRIIAAIVHDWLYTTRIITRMQADKVYKEICMAVGVSSKRANIEYATLRVFGRVAWNRSTMRELRNAVLHGNLVFV